MNKDKLFVAIIIAIQHLKRHLQSSNHLENDLDFDNLRSQITYYYHSNEKGLSNPRFRYNFGKKAFTQLFKAMDLYLEKDYPSDDTRFQQAISVIESYVLRHNQDNMETVNVTDKLETYRKYKNVGLAYGGGIIEKQLSELPKYDSCTFEELAMNRYSIRDFGEAPIHEQDVEDAVKIAIKTPSACNRQSSRAYYIKNDKLVEKLFHL